MGQPQHMVNGAMLDGTTLRIVYVDRKGERRERTIRPRGLVQWKSVHGVLGTAAGGAGLSGEPGGGGGGGGVMASVVDAKAAYEVGSTRECKQRHGHTQSAANPI